MRFFIAYFNGKPFTYYPDEGNGVLSGNTEAAIVFKSKKAAEKHAKEILEEGSFDDEALNKLSVKEIQL